MGEKCSKTWMLGTSDTQVKIGCDDYYKAYIEGINAKYKNVSASDMDWEYREVVNDFCSGPASTNSYNLALAQIKFKAYEEN